MVADSSPHRLIDSPKATSEKESMIKWVLEHIKITGFDSVLWKDEHSEIMLEFLTSAGIKSIFATVDVDTGLLIVCSGVPPEPSPGRIDVAYFVRAQGNVIRISNINDVLLYGTFSMRQTATSVLRIMDETFYPQIFHTREWNESNKTELMGIYHRFMASLTESSNEENGRTMLYLPRILEEGSGASLETYSTGDGSLVHQLESIAIHWTRQIKGVLNNHDHNIIASELRGPIEELAFWKSRSTDLTSIADQLNSVAIQNVISILRKVNSKYAKPVESLSCLVEQGSKESANIVKCLGILKEPCDKLLQLKPADIPNLHPSLLNCTGVIYSLSSNYNTYKRISDLLRRISGAIIRQCSSYISLHEAFHGDVDCALTMLKDCVDCGIKWKQLYNRTAVTVNKRIKQRHGEKTLSPWKLNDPSIFAEMEAFVQRCDDLMYICHGRIQFVTLLNGPENDTDTAGVELSPQFTGTNGIEIERSLRGASVVFETQIGRLKNLEYSIFDARASQWHNDFNMFKGAMKDLDVMVINVINTAFDPVKVIDNAVHLLQLFRNVAHRPRIKLCLEKKLVHVRNLFMEKCQAIRQEFDDFHRAPPLRMNEPRYAGSALWAKALCTTVEKWLDSVKSVTTRTAVADGNDIDNTCNTLISALVAYQRQKYDDWLSILSIMDTTTIQDRLDQPLLSRQKIEKQRGDTGSFIHIFSNFDYDITHILTETHFWDKLHVDEFAVPTDLLGLCHQREVLRVVHERVKMLVRAFNDLLDDVAGLSQLYSDQLRQLEKKMYPGFTKILWSTRPSVIERFVQIMIDQINKVHAQVIQFHQLMSFVDEQCKILSTLPLLRIDRNIIYNDNRFEEQQADHRISSRISCINCHERIKAKIEGVSEQFCNSDEEIQEEWQHHVSNIDNRILDSLLQCVKTSLLEFSIVINGQCRADETNPIFIIWVHLKNGRLECQPSMIKVTHSINMIIKELIGVVRSVQCLGRHKLGKCLPHSETDSYFYNNISTDASILRSVVQIMNGMASIAAEVRRILQRYDQYKALWEMDKESFLRRYSKSNHPLETYQLDLVRYKEQQALIQAENSSYTTKFIRLNFSSLKSVLLNHSMEFQEKLIGLLSKNTSTQIETHHKLFDLQIHKLKRPLRSVLDLKEMLDLVTELKDKVSGLQGDFGPLENAVKSLEKFDKTNRQEESKEMVASLKPHFDTLLDQVLRTEEVNQKAKLSMREDLQKSITDYRDLVSTLSSKVDNLFEIESNVPQSTVKDQLDILIKELDDCKRRQIELQPGLDLFRIDLPNVKGLSFAEDQIHLMKQALDLSLSWDTLWHEWTVTPFLKLNIESMDTSAKIYLKDINKMKREIKNWALWKKIRERLEEFKLLLPIIQNLMNEGMRKRHWNEIRNAIGRDFECSRDKFTMGDVFLLGLEKQAKLIEELALDANKELTIERSLSGMKQRLSAISIEAVSYKETYKIRSTEDLFNMIEDDLVSLSAIKASTTGLAFKDQIHELEKILNQVADVMEVILILQRKWLHLENVFTGSGDIQIQLPREYVLFSKVDDEFKKIMKKLNEKKSLSEVCCRDSSFSVSSLCHLCDQLEEIQKSLETYLEAKRKIFPRLYFVSDDDLLDVLGLSKQPELAQKHIKKFFEGLVKLKLTNDNETSTIFASGGSAPDGEELKFVHQVALEGPVELWLVHILKEMKLGVEHSIGESMGIMKASKRKDWVRQCLGQATITASAIYWTKSCSRALGMMKSGKDKHSLRAYRKKQISYLRCLTEMVRDVALQQIDRSKVVALLTMEIHNRDVIEKLLSCGCRDPQDFTWLSQLRFYFEKDLGCGKYLIKQNHYNLPYCYEYQGNNGRLVATPLTDRCVLTLLTAMCVHRGGSPLGPAGTGKTETVKDLAKNLAYYCVVFNCSEGMDYKSLGRLFSGLCQSGSWGCFDEFNRIKIEVISVVAMQVASIFNALRCKLGHFNFMGTDMKCSFYTGIFITMNPGYVGRTELPDNLKALMRPIAMVAPDLRLISEVILAAEGFIESRLLAKKTNTLYELMQHQLSKQSHYDYGLRNIKAVLKTAGKLKREGKLADEELIVIKAIQIINIPRFIKIDQKLFNLLLADMFPDKNTHLNEVGNLQDAVQQTLVSKHMQVESYLVQKTLQLANSQQSRHCNMLVGETLSGKTTIWQTLRSAKAILPANNEHFARMVHTFVINPKSLSVSDLYGSYDLLTFEWSDGVLSSIFRRCVENSKQDEEHWIIFDGPVDALWIESMNSVMDDNKMLTLINGERISLTTSMSLLFEVEDLSVASPATVSRAGMIYVDNDLGWKPFVKSWLHRQFTSPDDRSFISSLCDKYLHQILLFKEENCCEPIRVSHFAAIQAFTALSDSLLCKMLLQKKDFAESLYHRAMEKWFIFCLIWSVCSTVDESGRVLIDHHLRDIDSRLLPPRLIYEYSINPETNEFELWEKKVTKIGIGAPISFHDIVVPTIDTTRNSFVMMSLIENDHRVMIGGPTGSGKSMMAQLLLKNLPRTYSSVAFNLSSMVECATIQAVIGGALEKHSKDKLGPEAGKKKLVVFIDDLNSPKKTSTESPFQPPLELLRQLIEYNGWYERKNCSWQHILNTHVLSAMPPATGGRETIPNRLLSKFSLVNCIAPDQKSVVEILNNILCSKLGMVRTDVKSLFKVIAKATYEVFEVTKKKFLPMPEKSHYIFHLCDLFKVTQGLLEFGRTCISSKETLLRLWIHECMRTFSDRFTLDAHDDELMFVDVLIVALKNHFHSDFMNLTENSFDRCRGPIFAPIYDTTEEVSKGSNHSYTEIETKELLCKSLSNYLKDYNDNESFVPMNLVLFDDALKHICRINRVIQLERGNMLLVGLGGSGRESLTRLATFISGAHFFTIELTKSYRVSDFREDLKSLYIQCGIDNKRCVFFLKDTQIVNEAFLEIINTILVSGDIYGLFENDAIAEICNRVRTDALSAGLRDSKEVLWNFFLNKVKSNLHLILAMSPVGNTLASRFQYYPSLTTFMTINWFNNWPTEALEQVASKYLSDSQFPTKGYVTKISASFAKIHESALRSSKQMFREVKRYNYVTPANYLDLVQGYQALLLEKHGELSRYRSKLLGGLSKLEKGRIQVEQMRSTLENKKIYVGQSQQDCEHMLEKIVSEKIVAEEQEKKVKLDSERITKEEIQCKKIALEAKSDLAVALPALKEALLQVEKLDKSAITEIKSYSSPPSAVEKVLACVMILMGKPAEWGSAKTVLGETNFLTNLKAFDKDNVKNSTIIKVKKYVENQSFTADEVTKVSFAAGALCAWCHAIYLYAKVIKEVKPKRQRLRSAQDSLTSKQSHLSEAKHALETIVEKVNSLKDEYSQSVEQKNNLNAEADDLEDTLNRAERLITNLSGEYSRWKHSIDAFEKRSTDLPGDVLVACAFLSYSGPFNSSYRVTLMEQWISIVHMSEVPISHDFLPSSFLCSDSEIRNWNLQGLPKDNFSTENAIIVKRSNRWPLLIDPQQQGNKWIRALEGQNLKIIDPRMKDFLKVLETSITFGLTVLLQDISEEIDASLEPVLSKAIISTGGRKVIKLGEKDVDYNDNFNLYITTRLPNPHYTPDVSVKTNIVDFSLKDQGLDEQLLALVVNEEEPNLESQKSQLTVSIAIGKQRLIDLEDEILRLLFESKGSLLNDINLIKTLQASKATAEDINVQMLKTQETEKKTDSAREVYRSAARLSSIIYATLNEMSSINPMYQYSFGSYMDLFRANIKKSCEAGSIMTRNTTKRVEVINQYHMAAVHNHTCVGLLKGDKLLFSLRLCFRILQDKGEIPEEEFDYFCHGRISSMCNINAKKQNNKLAFDWLSNKACDALNDLGYLIKGLIDSIVQQEESWLVWYRSDKPETTPLPGKWDRMLSGLQKLCVVRALRLDRVLNAAALFVSNNIGSEFSNPPPLNLGEVFKCSTPKTPIILILSPGVDPTDQIIALAKSSSHNCVQVALGQGQGPTAVNLIRKACAEGFWVFLANCHLMLSWMKDLEDVIDCYCEKGSLHKNYRLWLSCNPDPHFPLSILHRSLKVTMEPPSGLRSNLLKLYDLVADESILCQQQATYKKLLFSLSWFHSILLERRKFKTLGFNNLYDFNDSDFTICKDLIVVLLEEYPEKIPFEAIKYFMGEAHYGGRVTDEWDQRVVNVYLNNLFCTDTVNTENFMLSDLSCYFIPVDGDLTSYKSFIHKLPQEDDPIAFGQQSNALISSQIQETNNFLQTIMTLQPRKINLVCPTVECATEDEIFLKLDNLPDSFDLKQIQDIFLEDPDLSILNAVLLQEAIVYNRLISTICNTIENLRKATKGLIIMTPDIKRDLTSITNYRVPHRWLHAYQSCKPLDSWIDDLYARLNQLRSWIEDGIPSVFWLGGLACPGRFLSAVLHNTARIKGIAIDSLAWDFTVIQQNPDQLTVSPTEGVYISGMYLEGARWDHVANTLSEPLPLELVSAMPVVYFRPVEGKKKFHSTVYTCPLYISQIRAGIAPNIPSYVLAIDLDVGLKCSEHYIKRGVALLLSTAE